MSTTLLKIRDFPQVMRKKSKLQIARNLLIAAIGLLFDLAEEYIARVRDLDQKVEHLIRRGRNGQNHN